MLESDTEVYGLVDPEGRTLVGNLSGWTARMSPLGRLTTQRVTRNGRASTSRLLPSPLPNGATLVVGRDVEDMHTLERVVWDVHFQPQTNVIDVQISRLRTKIDKDFAPPLLHTVRGVGYMVDAHD